MRSKWSLRREKKGEKKEKSGEEREERATEAKSGRLILVTVYVSRDWGGSQIGLPVGVELVLRRVFLRVLPQHRLFHLGFGWIRDFSENTSP